MCFVLIAHKMYVSASNARRLVENTEILFSFETRSTPPRFEALFDDKTKTQYRVCSDVLKKNCASMDKTNRKQEEKKQGSIHNTSA